MSKQQDKESPTASCFDEEEEEEDDTCPICCSDLDDPDQLYKLKCPTKSCHFRYCSDCLRGMQSASNDDYDMASDGSLQVKVKLMCPQCRTPYKSASYSSEVVVDAVLLLRMAHSVQSLLKLSDDNLSATALATKFEFCKSTSVDHVKVARRQVESYHEEIGKPTVVPPLDTDLLGQHLRGDANSSVPSSQQHKARNWKDPTLFLGLESVLTVDEQEFLTKLLVSGQPELLVQASFILHQMIHHPSTAKSTVQQLAQFTSSSANGTVPYDPARIGKLRQRYPLPRMPVCLPLAVSLVSKIQLGDDLVIKNTRGGAGIGRFGVRQGDTITHVGDVPVSTRDELQSALVAAEREGDVVSLTANASLETAKALEERANKMQAEKVRFL
jgi:hypothetical protein